MQQKMEVLSTAFKDYMHNLLKIMPKILHQITYKNNPQIKLQPKSLTTVIVNSTQYSRTVRPAANGFPSRLLLLISLIFSEVPMTPGSASSKR